MIQSSEKSPPFSRTPSGGFRTSEGTLYVSKPYRSKSSKKLRALITFAPRQSHFDINNESSMTNEFRGFFSLFWISIFLLTLQVYVRGIELHGRPLNLAFATMFSQDAVGLAISDAALILITGICVPIAIALKKRWIRYYWTGMIIQHLLQTTILFGAITWTFNRNWPWVQSGFLTLHCLVMIMKMHSYLSVNGQLQYADIQSEVLLQELHRATQSIGGWDEAIQTAKERCAEVDATLATAESSSNSPTPNSTPDIPTGATTSYTDISTANALRQRLTTVSIATGGNTSIIDPSKNNLDGGNAKPRGQQHPLADHPDQRIAEMAIEYSDLQSEMTSPGPKYVTWPNNISIRDFARFHMFPTLVYELEYPRTDRIRPLYVFEKTLATFGTFTLLYTVTEQMILPKIPTSEQSILRSLLDLSLPFMMAYLLLFYIIFECICNGFAELSRWNSTSWDEFSRKWNKPVHTFLLRHIYAPPVLRYGLSRVWAMILTFLFSACVHELVMVIVTKKLRMYIFILQLAQIPMILVSRLPFVKRNKLLGHLAFWLGLYTGFPLLCVAYVAY